MRIMSAGLFAVLLASGPALAAQGDGAKAEDVRRVAAQACNLEARYRPQCLDWFAPGPSRPAPLPAAAPARR